MKTVRNVKQLFSAILVVFFKKFVDAIFWSFLFKDFNKANNPKKSKLSMFSFKLGLKIIPTSAYCKLK